MNRRAFLQICGLLTIFGIPLSPGLTEGTSIVFDPFVDTHYSDGHAEIAAFAYDDAGGVWKTDNILADHPHWLFCGGFRCDCGDEE